MRETEYAYAVAKIRANELSLLTSNQLEGVITAPNHDAALRLLTDMGYADFTENEAEEVLKEKEKQAFRLICDIAPDKNLFDFLVVKNDFHNIKAVLKALVLNTDYSPYVILPCLIEPALIYRAVSEKDYSVLPEFAQNAAKKGYELITVTMDGQVMDVYLDKCYLDTSLKMAEKSGESFSVGLAERMALIADISIALRGGEMGKSADFLKDAMADSRLIDTNGLISAAQNGREELAGYLLEKGFDTLAEGMRISTVAFERAADDLLMDYVKGAKYGGFGIAPLIGYYLAKVSEVKTLRVILCCKRTQMSESETRERVRKLYV